ncbi:hypothetical protein HIM_01866 [Hirsutella minnesotensis 3608]|nr:hypothetical protein HIM_01866 [Hirsutella minnesotensis 3608]
MSAAGDNGGSVPPSFLLTPHQQSLLFAALNSNKQPAVVSPANNAMSLSPSSLKNSPMPSFESAASTGVRESPYLDNYDYDFGDSSFDFSFASVDQPQMIGDVPGTTKSDSTEGDSNDKRNHPDDEEGDESPGNDSKRHESTEKAPKKPGRKPLTSEPTSKRKAQNRAAQRAFRERKEKHLKDLETKVQELEKASEDANHENTKLRSQLSRITSELNSYKQKLAVLSNANKSWPRENATFGSAAVHNLNDVSFQFEFPKFGSLPGPPSDKQSISLSPNDHVSSPAQNQGNGVKSPHSVRPTSQDSLFKDEFARFSNGLVSSVGGSCGPGSRTSVDSGNMSLAASTSSPSASSNSNAGPNSSCGTSPEPFTQSPMGFKPLETLTTIGEEQPNVAMSDQPFAQFAHVDIGSPSLDWLANQNGGQFDPQLFGDYREPQDNILASSNFDDFFNDAFDVDFLNPYNVPQAPQAPKKNLIDEIDAKQNAVDEDLPKDPNVKCTEIWERLQGCPKAQSGEFDLDGLCSELTKKAKCSGRGPVVAEKDFNSLLKKYMGKDASSECMASSLGIEVRRDEKSNGVTQP